MRRGQSTVEYLVLIGIAVAVLIIMGVYMQRGYQGHVRGLGDQVGSQYSPSTAVLNNQEVKTIDSIVTSKSDTTTVYGDSGDTSATTSRTEEKTTETVQKAISESMGSHANESWN